MPYYLPEDDESRVCKRCGCAAVPRGQACPYCGAWCVYCKSKEHRVEDCPKVQPCGICHQKGHPTKRCRASAATKGKYVSQMKNAEGNKRLNASTNDPDSRKKRNKGYHETSDVSLSVKIKPLSQTDDKNWLGISKEIRESHINQPTRVVPTDFKDVCRQMLQDISMREYVEWIARQGGPDVVAKKLCSRILPDILALQGKEVSPELLENIRKNQVHEWPHEVGYLLFLTDDRDSEYLRPYVGQTDNSEGRIIVDHVQSILGGARTSLSYFIAWLGSGHRTASFIQLWGSNSGETDKTWQSLQQNLMENLFCIIFDSLPAKHESTEGVASRAGYGLNVLSPLLQNKCHEQQRAVWKQRLQYSPDPQIRYYLSWSEVHKGYLEKKQLRPNWLDTDFRAALSECIGPEMTEKVLQPSRVASSEVETPAQLQQLPWLGDLAAPVAFVLGHGRQSRQMQPREYTPEEWPWGLNGSGFTQSNSLVWTWNFTTFGPLSAADLRHTNSSPYKSKTCSWHKAIINTATNLRLVIMCGSLAQREVLASLDHYESSMLEIRGCRYKAFLSHQVQGHTVLLLACPELPLDSSAMIGLSAGKIAELLRFTAFVCGFKDLKPFFLESRQSIVTILSQRSRELLGQPSMTSKEIGPSLRIWLARKGLSKTEDLERLEQLAGSMSLGLIHFLNTLPRRDNRLSGVPAPIAYPKKSRTCQANLDPKTKDALKALCRYFLDRRQADYQAFTETKAREAQDLSSLDRQDNTSDPQVIVDDDNIVDILSTATPAMVDMLNITLEDDLDCIDNRPPQVHIDSQAKPNGSPRVNINSQARLKVPNAHNVKSWPDEAGKFALKTYELTLPTIGCQKKVQVGWCRINLGKLDVGDGKALLKIETASERHPEAFAQQAGERDPARKLCFRIYGKDSNGVAFTYTPRNMGPQAIFEANTFYEQLHFVDISFIRRLKRRHFYANRKSHYTSPLRVVEPEGEDYDIML